MEKLREDGSKWLDLVNWLDSAEQTFDFTTLDSWILVETRTLRKKME